MTIVLQNCRDREDQLDKFVFWMENPKIPPTLFKMAM